jgi:hypothetical protein
VWRRWRISRSLSPKFREFQALQCSRREPRPASSTAPLRWRERPGGASNYSTSAGSSTAPKDGACCGAARRTNTHVSGPVLTANDSILQRIKELQAVVAERVIASEVPRCSWRRQLLQERIAGAIETDEKMATDLAGPGYHINRSNLLVLESKANMQKRGQDSPRRRRRTGADLCAGGCAGGSRGAR